MSNLASFVGHHKAEIALRVGEHLRFSGLALAIALVFALPLAVWLAHTGRGALLAINAANIGRALPSLALIALAVSVPGLGFRARSIVVALVALGIPPIMTNAYVGVRGVDRDVIEAARGMGLSGGDILRRVELPLAAPVIMAGIRTAAVQIVATATLAAMLPVGGLGRLIIDGVAIGDHVSVAAGALFVALLAILTEVTFGWVERLVTPAGIAFERGRPLRRRGRVGLGPRERPR